MLPAFLLGVGLGGFVDGILLHQALQWHHLLSDTGDHPVGTVSGLEANMLAEAPRAHLGMLLAGWGAFNLAEGLVNHQLLGIHHLRDDLGAPLGWDLAFLAFGATLLAGGLAMAREPGPLAEGAASRT